MFKIIASDAGAHITTNCTTEGDTYEVNNYNLGFRKHTVISISHDYCIVDSDESILIIQFKDSNELPKDTFMTGVPALKHFQTKYVFNTYATFKSYVVLSVKNTDPNPHSLLLNKNTVVLEWKSLVINENTYYFSTLLLTTDRYMLEFSGNRIKFGAAIYGIEENGTNTYALPAGLALELKEDLPVQGAYKL